MSKKIEVKSNLQKAEQIVNKILSVQRHSIDRVFEDILDIYICVYSFGEREEIYHEIKNRYTEKEFEALTQIFADIMVAYQPFIESNTDYDLLGSVYELLASNSQKSGLGQFFTPLHLTHMMALMVLGTRTNNIILANEPSCGSGRNIISIFNQNPNVIFNTVDLDRICVKMTIVNMHLYQMIGSEVIQGNSLSMESYKGYRLTLDYPNVEKMFGKVWADLPEEKQQELRVINSYRTMVIKEIHKDEIINLESMAFKAIRKNVNAFNNLNKIFEIIKNPNQKEAPKEEFPTPNIEQAIIEAEQFYSLKTVPEEKIIEQEKELKKEIEVVKLEQTNISFEFKKPKKYENQISLFDI